MRITKEKKEPKFVNRSVYYGEKILANCKKNLIWYKLVEPYLVNKKDEQEKNYAYKLS